MKKEATLAFTIEPNGDYFLAFDGDGRRVAKIYDEEFAEKLAAVVNSHEALVAMVLKLREAFYIKGTSKDVREAFASINDEFKSITQEGK